MKILKKAVLFFGVILGINPFFCGKAIASSPIVDDFNSYQEGILSGQGGWFNYFNGNDDYPFVVETGTTYEGIGAITPYSTYHNSTAIKFNSDYTEKAGTIEFYIKLNCGGYSIGTPFGFYTLTYDYFSWENPLQIFYIDYNGSTRCLVTLDGYIVGNFDLDYFNEWRKITYEWTDATHTRVKIDNGSFSNFYEGSAAGTIRRGIVFFSPEHIGQGVYIDNIREYVGGQQAVITPTTPPCGYTYNANFSSTTLSGKISISDDNPNIYNKFAVLFEDAIDPLSEKSQWHFFNFPTSSAGSIVNYNYQVSLWAPTSSSYNINYYLGGYNAETGKAVFENLQCGTITPLLGVDIQDIQQYATYTTSSWLMNCDGLQGTEWWFCRLNNIIEGIFMPSQEKISELKKNVDLLKEKFPQNYINAFADFLKNVKTGINNASTSLSFKVWGQQGTVNFDFWNKNFTMLGATQTISGIFRGFAYFISLLIFVLWSLNFGKRIFK